MYKCFVKISTWTTYSTLNCWCSIKRSSRTNFGVQLDRYVKVQKSLWLACHVYKLWWKILPHNFCQSDKSQAKWNVYLAPDKQNVFSPINPSKRRKRWRRAERARARAQRAKQEGENIKKQPNGQNLRRPSEKWEMCILHTYSNCNEFQEEIRPLLLLSLNSLEILHLLKLAFSYEVIGVLKKILIRFKYNAREDMT